MAVKGVYTSFLSIYSKHKTIKLLVKINFWLKLSDNYITWNLSWIKDSKFYLYRSYKITKLRDKSLYKKVCLRRKFINE
ncbi:hypothetical protein D2A34_23035 [Clostridium chromiireducens]|uniref:Uncharacterized protein n=1 Tax=Clostridium chromiireducens TaxID=225345 RepID=A0A1V4IHS0_9CLOT|nr:hypothetical protein CLCHR_36700 [Clostridium chromiireducens]RII32546.1 hypothetical protein D2A34_23035 [Clostridium chromiireducens]